MKTIQIALATLVMTAASTWAVGVMGALFRGCWQSIALEKALLSECGKSKDSPLCYTARQVVADDLQTLIKFCESLPESSAAQTTLKQARHDLELVKKANGVYEFELSLQGGPQWSSGDSAASSPTSRTGGAPSNDDARMITERVNTFFKKYQTPQYRVVERELRAEYLTKRYQRERAEEDKHPENMDGDPYTLADAAAPSEVGVIEVKAVEIQGLRAEASVTRAGQDHGMKVSLMKEAGKWLIDKIFFARR